VWATAIRESQLPAEPELERLERVFLPWGAAKKDLYETAEAPEKVPGETEAVCAEQRRNYTSGEARRVGVSFAVAAKDAHSSVILGAQDTDKTIAAIEGPVPDDAGDVELTEDGLRAALAALEDEAKYGAVLRAKGIVPCTDGGWIHFDYTPGEQNIRKGPADYTGRLCVIGSKLVDEKLASLFGVA